MERPGFVSPLCATSTNRSLYAISSQIPLDKLDRFHRRMTHRGVECRFHAAKVKHTDHCLVEMEDSVALQAGIPAYSCTTICALAENCREVVGTRGMYMAKG